MKTIMISVAALLVTTTATLANEVRCPAGDPPVNYELISIQTSADGKKRYESRPVCPNDKPITEVLFNPGAGGAEDSGPNSGPNR